MRASSTSGCAFVYFTVQVLYRGWDGWMASPTQWTWVWASSGRQWRTEKPGVLQSVGLQRVRHYWVTEQQQLCGLQSYGIFISSPEPVPSTSGRSDTVARPPSPMADHPSALPSPASSPSSGQWLLSPVHSMPAPVCQLLYWTTLLFKVLYCKITNDLFIFLCLVLCIICMNSIINLLQYSTI